MKDDKENPYDKKNPYTDSLYSFNGGLPEPLPLYVTVETAEGRKTFSAEAAVENAEAAGWKRAAERPVFDPDVENVFWNGDEWIKVPRELADVYVSLIERINREAADERTAFSTLGLEAIYLQKSLEARAFRVDPDPQPLNYPFLFAEARETGRGMNEVVAGIFDALTTSARIEGIRRGALLSLEEAYEAGNREAMKSVFPVKWVSTRLAEARNYVRTGS